jgi:hypothetical protein
MAEGCGGTTGGAGARGIVDRHERSIPATRRRRLGAHYTPEALSALLVDLAVEGLGRLPGLLCDPCCGAGAVLLAAADRLCEAGVPAREVVAERLVGFDIDPSSVRATAAALRRWAVDRGVADPPEAQVHVADTLGPARQWAGRRAGRIDAVVGNPPFLSQLAGDTAFGRERRLALAGAFGGGMRAYTDAAGLHLLAGLDAVREAGVVCLLQPTSVLANRDAAPVRAAALARASLAGLWAGDERAFDAAVWVCAPVLRRREAAQAGGDPALAGGAPAHVGGDGSPWLRWNDGPPRPVTAPSAGGASWGGMLAAGLGVPLVPSVAGGRRLGDVAECTAGFRDEFYALAAAATDGGGGGDAGDRPGSGPRLVTAGMIDPGVLRWGARPSRLAGRVVVAPRADLALLDEGSPRVAAWARRRLVPKVLVATQTRVVEAVVDEVGDCLPVTPVVSVEPGPAVDLAAVAGLLTAPSTSAALAAELAGSGRSLGAIRVSAAALGRLVVPDGDAALAALAEAWASHDPASTDDEAWRSWGRRLDAALGVADDGVLDWWCARRPRR